jgi:hypothetical protein
LDQCPWLICLELICHGLICLELICLGLIRTSHGNREDPGGGPVFGVLDFGIPVFGVSVFGVSVFGIGAATGLGPLTREHRDHGGHGPVFEAGWRLDVRGQALDNPADLAVLLHDALAVTAISEMAVEPGTPSREHVAEYEIESLGMGQFDISLR